MDIKLIVAGSRDLDDQRLIDETIVAWMENTGIEWGELHIVSGGAFGVDECAERFATNNQLPFTIYPALWQLQGKRAGFVRNERMAENADYLLAIWDGKSKGTKHMIDIGDRYGLNVTVVEV